MAMIRTTAAAFLVGILALLNQGAAHVNVKPEQAAHSSALETLPSLLLFKNEILIVTQTTIEEPAPCRLSWPSRAMGRFFQRPCCKDLQVQATAQHRVNHMKAVADSLGTMLPVFLRPKSVDVRDIAQQWLQEDAKKRAVMLTPAEQEFTISHGAV